MMEVYCKTFVVSTRGKGTYEITSQLHEAVRASGVQSGQLSVLLRHTSASLVLFENADASARTDLHRFFEELVPEDYPGFVHTYEGADDMPSHIRMALTRSSECLPIIEGRLALGTWQGVFVFEHRRAAMRREVAVSIIGKG